MCSTAKFVFLSEVAHRSFGEKFSGLIESISKLTTLEKIILKSANIQRTDLYLVSNLKLKNLWSADEAFRIIFASKTINFAAVLFFLAAGN